jgi:hypothetical protein
MRRRRRLRAGSAESLLVTEMNSWIPRMLLRQCLPRPRLRVFQIGAPVTVGLLPCWHVLHFRQQLWSLF